jgi:hypothetical protein
MDLSLANQDSAKFRNAREDLIDWNSCEAKLRNSAIIYIIYTLCALHRHVPKVSGVVLQHVLTSSRYCSYCSGLREHCVTSILLFCLVYPHASQSPGEHSFGTHGILSRVWRNQHFRRQQFFFPVPRSMWKLKKPNCVSRAVLIRGAGIQFADSKSVSGLERSCKWHARPDKYCKCMHFWGCAYNLNLKVL